MVSFLTYKHKFSNGNESIIDLKDKLAG
jgi:hypothetical protein